MSEPTSIRTVTGPTMVGRKRLTFTFNRWQSYTLQRRWDGRWPVPPTLPEAREG